MFMSKFKQWLDEVDPYTIQRLVLYKSLFVATIMTFVYWIFLPVNYLAFLIPFFVVFLYELPILSTFKIKEEFLYFISVAIILISVSFYLLYPFKGVFFFFSLATFALLYYVVLKKFYAIKSLIMMTLSMGTIILATKPEGDVQIAYGFVSSIVLTSVTLFISLRIVANHYLRVWNKALQKFIECLEQAIGQALLSLSDPRLKEEVLHFEMVRNYQFLLEKKSILSSYRMAVFLRNIQLALDNIHYERKNDIFWLLIQKNLALLRANMNDYISCDVLLDEIKPETNLQTYVKTCLKSTIKQWNNLCFIQHN